MKIDFAGVQVEQPELRVVLSATLAVPRGRDQETYQTISSSVRQSGPDGVGHPAWCLMPYYLAKIKIYNREHNDEPNSVHWPPSTSPAASTGCSELCALFPVATIR